MKECTYKFFNHLYNYIWIKNY